MSSQRFPYMPMPPIALEKFLRHPKILRHIVEGRHDYTFLGH